MHCKKIISWKILKSLKAGLGVRLSRGPGGGLGWEQVLDNMWNRIKRKSKKAATKKTKLKYQ